LTSQRLAAHVFTSAGDSLSPIISKVASRNAAYAEQELAAARRAAFEDDQRHSIQKVTSPNEAARIAASLRKAVPIAKPGGSIDEQAEELIDSCMDRDLQNLKALIAVRTNVNYVDEVRRNGVYLTRVCLFTVVILASGRVYTFDLCCNREL